MTDQIPLVLVGAGTFGSLHAQKLSTAPDGRLAAIVDAQPSQAQALAARFGGQALTHLDDLPTDIQAGFVASPASTHFAVARTLLKRGLDLFVEKPLACTRQEAETLCELAEKRGALLQVGHLERWNPVVLELLRRGVHPQFLRMERSGPFNGRGTDVNVGLDLMTHDLDLVRALTGQELLKVQAWGARVQSAQLDILSATLELTDGVRAELYASRVANRKVRGFSLATAEDWFEVDLTERTLHRTSRGKPTGEPEHLDFPVVDVIEREDRAFLRSVVTRETPRVDGRAGLASIVWLEKIMEQAGNGGLSL